jgi:mannose-6-phosphate isomerase-like protein (cupin superfamily)
MEPFVLVVRPEEVDAERRFRHAGEEFLFVLEGRCEYRVGEETFDLKPGDSLYFDATKPHAPLPKGGPAMLLAVFMPHAASRRMIRTKTKTHR